MTIAATWVYLEKIEKSLTWDSSSFVKAKSGPTLQGGFTDEQEKCLLRLAVMLRYLPVKEKGK